MLFYIAIVLSIVASVGLLIVPRFGLCAIFVIRPIIDTTWDKFLLFGIKLTELVSVLVPAITFYLIFINNGTRKSVTRIPLYSFWMIYIVYVCFFCMIIALSSSILDSVNVFFRFMNGFAGFYLVQTYCRGKAGIQSFFIFLAVAGVFPVATGLYEALTGHHWKVTMAEGQIRNIGLYHDAITIRYYGLQTVLAVIGCFLFGAAKNKITQILLIFLIAGALITIFNALSKSGIATLLLWIVIWSYAKKDWKLPVFLLVGILILMPFYFQGVVDTVHNIFHKELGALTGEIETERTFAGRWLLWKDMLEEWAGFNSFQKLFGSGHITLYAHNDYMQILFHGGIIGLVLYLIFLFTIGLKILSIYLSTKSNLSIFALMVFVMWIIDTIGLVPSLYTGYQWFVWGIIGLSLRRHSDYLYYKKKIFIKKAVGVESFKLKYG